MNMLVAQSIVDTMLHLKIGEEYIGTVVWSDSDIDLSIVKIDKIRIR